MQNNADTGNLLSLLEGFTLDNSADIIKDVAADFRRRRVEKNITRQRISELSGVPLSTVARFEREGLIAFESLVRLAMALGYTSEVRHIFGTPKFQTMEELDRIRRKSNDTRAYVKTKKQ